MANSYLSSEAKERRRMRAIFLKKQGWKQYQIARELRVSEAAVSQWLRVVKEKGVQALRSRPHPGAPPKLPVVHVLRLLETQGRNVKTRAGIAELIKQKYGISYHKASLSRIMSTLKVRYIPNVGWTGTEEYKRYSDTQWRGSRSKRREEMYSRVANLADLIKKPL